MLLETVMKVPRNVTIIRVVPDEQNRSMSSSRYLVLFIDKLFHTTSFDFRNFSIVYCKCLQ